ncbi:MAG: T9SS type A sorting domain-containing protein [Chloroflexota bacterium]
MNRPDNLPGQVRLLVFKILMARVVYFVYYSSNETAPETRDRLGLLASYANETLTINANSTQILQATVTIYDLLGKPIKKQPFNIAKGENATYVKLIDLTPGAYVYSISIGTTTVNSGKFIVE